MAKNIKNIIIFINNCNFPLPTIFPHFRKNIQNSFQEGCKPDTCQPRVSDSEGPNTECNDELSMNEMNQ